MKDNHFDFIKEKFDNSGVNAPDALSEEAVTAMLPEQPLQALPPKKSKKKLAIGVSAAAACAVLTAGAITFTGLLHSVEQPAAVGKTLFAQTTALRSFQSRGELQKEMNNTLTFSNGLGRYIKSSFNPRYYQYREATDDALDIGAASSYASGSSGSSSNGSSGSSSNGSAAGNYNSSSMYASPSHNSTYIQSAGVDEADMVKTTDRYIFYCNGSNTITVFSADGKNAVQVAELEAPEDDIWMQNFYIVGDRLVMLGEKWQQKYGFLGSGAQNDFVEDDFYQKAITVATVYDISDISAVKQLSSFSQSGSYVDSRMIGDTLYLISNEGFSGDNELPRAGVFAAGATADSATLDEVPVEDIYVVENPVDNSFLVVSSIDTQNGAQATKTKSILGSADTIYCNQQNLYITARSYTPEVYDLMLRYYQDDATGETQPYDYQTERTVITAEAQGAQQTQLFKISLENDIEFVASGSVNGTVNNQYSLDEYNGYLRIATTSYDINSSLSGDTNNLYVFDSQLKQVGAVTDFAYGEHIKAVRFINETAYVITYVETDPLFVIDVSDPTAPAILGEVKISGFSTMLVPVDDNTLLGIGYHTSETNSAGGMEYTGGVKIVTFDVTDKANPQVLDTKIYKGFASQVQENPRALLVNFERGDYSIPMQHIDWWYKTYSGGDTASQNNDSCDLLNFRVENGKIKVIDEYKSPLFIGETYAERCVYVGDNQYLLGSEYSSSTGFSSVIDCVPYK